MCSEQIWQYSDIDIGLNHVAWSVACVRVNRIWLTRTQASDRNESTKVWISSSDDCNVRQTDPT